MTNAREASLFPVPGHNHGACLHQAVDRAERLFLSKGLKLTRLRRKIFEEIAGSHLALGAYDILDSLARKGDRLAPISVYRAIDALLEVGVVHRLESRNAFFACHAGHGDGRRPVVLACERCGLVAEVDGERIFEALAEASRAAGFTPQRLVVEVTGNCGRCHENTAADVDCDTEKAAN